MRTTAHRSPAAAGSRTRNWSPTRLGARSAFDVPSPHAAAPRLGADDLFTALDGHHVVTADGDWQIEVHSIYDEAGYRWIQLTLAGSPNYSLTFRLPTDEGVPKAIDIVSSWLAAPEETHVLM